MSGNIDPEKITTSPIEVGKSPTVPIGSDPFKRDPIIDQKIGIVGRFFGYGESAYVNIVGLTLVVFMILLVGDTMGIVFSSDPDTKKFLIGAITPIFGVITGAIGFVIGKKEN